MRDDDFLAMCKSIDPSVEVDRKKNLESIRNKLSKEEEKTIMIKNKKIRKPAVVAAVLIAVMSISAVAYAAAPAVWRLFDTQVIQGEEFVTDFFVGEVDLPDGTTSIGGAIDVDREALEAAGGGAVIVEVDGEEWVYLDELHLDSLEDGLALLQLENLLLPSYLPEGFSFSRFTFPVNPNNHEYRLGVLPSAKQAYVYFSNGSDTIHIQIGYASGLTLGTVYWAGQQAVTINGNDAVLVSGSLSNEESERLESMIPRDWTHVASDMFVSSEDVDVTPALMMHADDVIYSIRTESENVTLYDLIRIAESM